MNRSVAMMLGLTVVALCGFAEPEGQDPHAEERQRMVAEIKGRGIENFRVLEAMARVPRHLFVDEKLHPYAYSDRALPIGHGQTISQPYIVALMTEQLRLQGNERVLEVGTGSGYQAAVLAQLAREVYTVEIDPFLARKAEERLIRFGYTNVRVKVGDGFFGWSEVAPFDRILVTAATPQIPSPLLDQLRSGGILVMPRGQAGEPQKLVRVQKIGDRLQTEEMGDVAFVPLVGEIRRRVDQGGGEER